MMPERVPEAIKDKISVMVNSIELATAFNHQALDHRKPLHVHVKVDSGMHRLGLLPEDIKPFANALPALKNIHIEGLFTHFPNADDLQDSTTYSHIEYFSNAVADFQSLGIRPDIIHAANSAASLYFPAARFDAIRPGIAIYGLNPDFGAPLPEGFTPALTCKGRITSIKSIPAGEGIGYNYRYRTTRTERIGAASVGYADGLRRRLGNIALLGGKRINQVGGMCMDQSLWQLDGNPEAKVGDEIVFVGRQGNEQLTAEEIGRLWGSNNYDVVCGLSARVPRLYYSG
jgi:alanine racemase